MVNEPLASVAVATPVTLVVVTAGASRVLLGGQVMTGAVVSRTVIVWVQLELLLHWSFAVHVREMTRVFPQFVVIRSLKVTMDELQASVAVATPVLVGLMSAGNSSVRLVGQVMTGGFRSRTVMD